jgi:hypothetical protein
VLLLASGATHSQGIEELERRLARTPPVSTSFVEYRFSQVLKRPARASGTLEYRADGVMVRDVKSPHLERTEVSADEVRIQRGQRPVRRLSLQRAPQLRVLLASFRALLDGRITPLAEDFEVSLAGDAPRWRLTLRPRDARLAKYLERIEVYGSGDRPRCLEAVEPDGDATLTLFDSAAPPATRVDRAMLEQQCRAASAPAPETS